ncbi:uncharacterized protein LOC119680583 [Teleopsis dalmanni]|uniref:uncharacterized protein LOC119680583 n=1 Tax=Teleopsis dalmanni TaxID=139649 RepID=UPI0018CDC5D1|nr:uncharacterized protein LOC119680583 [Teleopsis dalmanni]
MLPLCCIKKMLLFIFFMRVAALPPHLPQHSFSSQILKQQLLYDDTNKPPQYFDNSLPQSIRKINTGNGYTLAPTEIAFATIGATHPFAVNQQSRDDWYALWLKDLQRRQKQQFRTTNFRTQKVLHPFAQKQRSLVIDNTNAKDNLQFNEFGDDNEYSKELAPNRDEHQILNVGDNVNYALRNDNEQLLNDKNMQKRTDNNKDRDSAEIENYDKVFKMSKKRKPLPIGDQWPRTVFDIITSYEEQAPKLKPRYPYALSERDNDLKESLKQLEKMQNYNKREKLRTDKDEQQQFVPSISAGTMTNLGDFFRDLSTNVNFSENSKLSHSGKKLLEGEHSLRSILEEQFSNDKDVTDGDPNTKTSGVLHAIRNYRPSQKIRSLVAMNPPGYHGSHFIDPNYMWVGLGK